MYVVVFDKKSGEKLYDFIGVVAVETLGGHKISLWFEDDTFFPDSNVFLKLEKNEGLSVYRVSSDHKYYSPYDTVPFSVHDIEADAYK